MFNGNFRSLETSVIVKCTTSGKNSRITGSPHELQTSDVLQANAVAHLRSSNYEKNELTLKGDPELKGINAVQRDVQWLTAFTKFAGPAAVKSVSDMTFHVGTALSISIQSKRAITDLSPVTLLRIWVSLL